MKYFEVEGPLVTIAAGVTLHLTDAQASARKHALKAVKERANVFTTHAPTQFKRGEQFGADKAPGSMTKELTTSTAEFHARVEHDRRALAAWKKGELDKRGAAARKIAEDRKRREAEQAAAAKRKAESRAQA